MTSTTISPETLDEILEFGHVIRVDPDGVVQDMMLTNSPIFAPDLYVDDGGDWELSAREPWALIHGKSNQYGYSGPLMHSSEYISEGWAREILSKPGYWVTIVAYPDDDGEVTEWALAYLPLDYAD